MLCAFAYIFVHFLLSISLCFKTCVQHWQLLLLTSDASKSLNQGFWCLWCLQFENFQRLVTFWKQRNRLKKFYYVALCIHENYLYVYVLKLICHWECQLFYYLHCFAPFYFSLLPVVFLNHHYDFNLVLLVACVRCTWNIMLWISEPEMQIALDPFEGLGYDFHTVIPSLSSDGNLSTGFGRNHMSKYKIKHLDYITWQALK
jgi:hypothetical protein